MASGVVEPLFVVRGYSSVPGCDCLLYWDPSGAGAACLGCGWGPDCHRLCYLDRNTALLYPMLVEDGELGVQGEESIIASAAVDDDEDVDDDSSSGLGRPRVELDLAEIIEYRRDNFKWTDIAKLLVDCSVSKLKTWRKEVNFDELHEPKSKISDEILRGILVDFLAGQPARGYGSAEGHLLAMGLYVPRARIRDAVRNINPQAVRERLARPIPRREYDIVVYNYLWHIDGNHKLITWGIVIHGIIDGATRLNVSLVASNNNRADTVYQNFAEATSEFGVPWRMRGDDGGENNRVAEYMDAQGPLRSLGHLDGFIRGPSVHNTRIESHWNQMRPRCIQRWINLFKSMSSTALPQANRLKGKDDDHKFVLQHLFLPLINHDLAEFRAFWNSHKLSTELHYSPVQLRVLSLKANVPAPPATISAVDYGIEQLGLDLEAAGQERAEGGRQDQPFVQVHSPLCALNDFGFALFQHHFPPVLPTPQRDHFPDLFLSALEYYQRLARNAA